MHLLLSLPMAPRLLDSATGLIIYTRSLFLRMSREYSRCLFCSKCTNPNSFLNDVAYWGSTYEVASPDDPIVLVDNTCITYSSDAPLSKRSTVDSFVANSTGPGCFGGLVECSTTVSAGNSSCTLASDDSSTKTSKRAQQCYNLPALFYNCDLFGTADITNRNQLTMGIDPTVSFIGMFPLDLHPYTSHSTSINKETLTLDEQVSARTFTTIC